MQGTYCTYICRPNIFLDIHESKQDYEKELNWLLEYLLRDEACLKKIIVYCRQVITCNKYQIIFFTNFS